MDDDNIHTLINLVRRVYVHTFLQICPPNEHAPAIMKVPAIMLPNTVVVDGPAPSAVEHDETTLVPIAAIETPSTP